MYLYIDVCTSAYVYVLTHTYSFPMHIHIWTYVQYVVSMSMYECIVMSWRTAAFV